MNEPNDPPTAPEPIRSSSYTHKLLEKYYSTVTALRDLLPPQRGDDDGFDDSESFRRLVGETVVASRAPAGPPRLDAAALGQGANGASMPEVSRPPFRAPVRVLFSRNLQTHPLPFPLAQIIEQVQQRLFAAHAKEYYRERKAGNVAFATPKNMLAFGYRLVRPLSSALSHSGSDPAAFSHQLNQSLSLLEHGANAGFATDEEPARARFRRGVPQHDRRDARLVPRLGPARQPVS